MTVAFIILILIASFLLSASSVILDNKDTYSEFSKSVFSEFSEFCKFSKISEISEISETSKISFIFNFILDSISDFIDDFNIIIISVYDNKDTLEILKIALTTSIITFTITPNTLSTMKLIIWNLFYNSWAFILHRNITSNSHTKWDLSLASKLQNLSIKSYTQIDSKLLRDKVTFWLTKIQESLVTCRHVKTSKLTMLCREIVTYLLTKSHDSLVIC